MKREINLFRMSFRRFCDGSDVLAGSSRGKQAFSELCLETVAPTAPTIGLLDFNDIRIATGSYLREAVYAYRVHARTQWPFLYPVVANANESILEELTLVLNAKSDAMIAVDHTHELYLGSPRLIGQLDGKQRETLKLLVDRKVVEAPGLAKEFGELATAWNNRLAALCAKGLAIEESLGRSKRYYSLTDGLDYGR